MFTNSRNIQKIMEMLVNVNDSQAFDLVLHDLRTYMKDVEMDPKYLFELEKRAYYFTNSYSDKDTKEKILEAKNRVIEYVNEIMSDRAEEGLLIKVLENYYLFLENLIERKSHKNGGIQREHLENLKIKNEYDIQHLLFAYLKPLYPMARTEVNEDTGYNTVRADICIDSDNVIEVKCTRKSMILKKLIEEIEADMIHYKANNIYFFIYDKEKIIENPLNFIKTYEKKVGDKHIHIIIHQPKIL